MAKYRLTENKLRGIISEAIKRVLNENKEEEMINALSSMPNIKETTGMCWDDAEEFLSDSGRKIVENGGAVFTWTIYIGNRNFSSVHNFPSDMVAERHCKKYIKSIGGRRIVRATIDVITYDNEFEPDNTDLLMDTVVCYEPEYDMWYD